MIFNEVFYNRGSIGLQKSIKGVAWMKHRESPKFSKCLIKYFWIQNQSRGEIMDKENRNFKNVKS